MFHLRQQQVSKQEVAQVIGSHLHLKPVSSLHIWTHHNTYNANVAISNYSSRSAPT